MLTREENELLARVGAGTGMGDLMRRYWLPAALSSELPEADCPPIRVKLLGERLVAFRDSRGRVGLVDEFCAHRRASLFLGRNEEAGLRCVYHGWKYDAEGHCVDMPNEPPESQFKNKIQLKAYPTAELGDVIWAYMGPKEKTPPLPRFEWTQVPESNRHVTKTWQECNWLQAFEGTIDIAHASFLHTVLTPDTPREGTRGYYWTARVWKIEVDLTDYGYVWWSIGPLGQEGTWVRLDHYIMPFHELRPFQLGFADGLRKPIVEGHMMVPIDDDNTMVYNFSYRYDGEPLREKEWIEGRRGRGPGDQTVDFRKRRDKNNEWLIDRRVQKGETFTGIDGVNTQDHAIQESMGPIVDRTKEHLGGSDRAVFVARRLLIQAVKTVQAGGHPPGIQPSYYSLRAFERVLPKGVEWEDGLKEQFMDVES